MTTGLKYFSFSQEESDPGDPSNPCVNYPTELYRSYADCDDQFVRSRVEHSHWSRSIKILRSDWLRFDMTSPYRHSSRHPKHFLHFAVSLRHTSMHRKEYLTYSFCAPITVS